MVVSKEIDIGKDSKDVQDIMYVLFASSFLLATMRM